MSKKNVTSGLAALAALGAMAAEEGEEELPPSVQAKRLGEAFRRYIDCKTACPFVPGELVTPRADSYVKGAGEPRIVLEVIANPEPHFTEPGTSENGLRCDMRVASMCGESVAAFWVESWCFEAWKGSIAA